MIERLRLFGKAYTVELQSESQLETKYQGRIDYQKCLITILAGLASDASKETLLHEIVHALEHELQLNLSEQQVGALSVGLWAACQANPTEMRWVLGLDSPTVPAEKKTAGKNPRG